MDVARTRSEAEPRGAESPFGLGLRFYARDRAAEGTSEAADSCRGAA